MSHLARHRLLLGLFRAPPHCLSGLGSRLTSQASSPRLLPVRTSARGCGLCTIVTPIGCGVAGGAWLREPGGHISNRGWGGGDGAVQGCTRQAWRRRGRPGSVSGVRGRRRRLGGRGRGGTGRRGGWRGRCRSEVTKSGIWSFEVCTAQGCQVRVGVRWD